MLYYGNALFLYQSGDLQQNFLPKIRNGEVPSFQDKKLPEIQIIITKISYKEVPSFEGKKYTKSKSFSTKI